MRLADLDILVHEGEGSMLEYKESFSSSLARELVAFANSAGGKILLGVRDDGTVVGVHDSNDLRAKVQDIARNCDPPVKVLLEPVGKVMVVHVRESENKPVQCRDGFFWRQGAGTQKLSRDEIRDFFRSEGSVRFDLAICSKFRYPQDFDRDKYNAWIEESGITRKGRIEDVLVNIEAAERSGGRLVMRNAGVLFFAKDVYHFFPQAYVTCLLAKGGDKADILDRKDFRGGVVSDIEESLRFVQRNTRTAYRIEKLRREDVPEYPMRALREAITNAVMHRDYFEAGANVFVEIYGDRIEVSNPGGLPKGLTRAELGTRSVRRNPLIADLLHRIAFIEKAGTGIRRMREEARKTGCPEPTFGADGFFTATFRPRTAQVTPQVTPHVTPHVTPQVTPQVRAVLSAVAQDGKTRDALQRAGKIKDREHFRKRYLEPLLAAGWLEMTIPDKPRSSKQKYRTTELGLEMLRKRKAET
ncbi:MAG: putative DNA binding domain-containing protein [Deltaproteobacteria bacterium]|nr:putative DNA binding domain-containing protein [Deltaproteobacteria bacterium]